eukprot:evm.model.scf_11.29 EVM.evm.TU.scf_11.29   scf_11:256419-264268(+)
MARRSPSARSGGESERSPREAHARRKRGATERSRSPSREHRRHHKRHRSDRDRDEPRRHEGQSSRRRSSERRGRREGRGRSGEGRRDGRARDEGGFDRWDGGEDEREGAPEGRKREKGTAGDGDGDKAAPRQPQPIAPVKGVFGGVYVPPFRLAQMMKQCQDKSGPEYQRMTWDALRKSLNGIVNKVNATNMKNMLPELFGENLIRGRGLFCRAVMKSQMASPTFTPVYAALVAVVNTKFPEIGELLLKRVILQFKRAYRRNDKPVFLAATQFLAHLVNQAVAHELLALELLMVLLENPSDNSVEVAVSFTKEVGATLQELSPQGLHSVFERLRAILHEGEIDKRVQFMIEGLFAVRKAGFATSGFPAVQSELDLIEEEDQITHEVGLDTPNLDAEMGLDVFKLDEEYEQHEKEYEAIKMEILGESDKEDGDSESSGSDREDGEGEEGSDAESDEDNKMEITDMTYINEVNLRRTIYLTIMSSLDFEEAGHKLLKIHLNPGQECEIVTMIIECCSQERTYLRYYGLLSQRFCFLNSAYQKLYEESFSFQYSQIHRLETNKLRNVAKLMAHLLATDAISWSVLGIIRLTEEDTTSSSRIFIKILFQELSEILGLIKLNARLQDPDHLDWFEGIFPKDTPRNMRFSINYFTSIGLGGLTDTMRTLLANLPKLIAQQKSLQASDGSGSSESSGDLSSSSGSSSDSDSSGPSDSSSESSSSDSKSSDSSSGSESSD